MRKYIPKFQPGGNTPDPLGSDRNNVRTKRIGNYLSEKRKFEKAATEAGAMGDDARYTRERYNEEKEINKSQRQSERAQRQSERQSSQSFGNPPGLSENGLAIMGGISKGVSMATSLANNFIDIDEDSNFTGQQAVGNALLSSGNPYAMAAGAAFNVLSTIGEATDTNVSTIDKRQASTAGLSKGERILNNVLGYIPMAGLLSGGKTQKPTEMTDETKQLSNAFGGSVNDISVASTMGDNRYVFGKNKINSLIDIANRDNKLFTELSVTNTQRKQSDYGSDLAQQNINRYAGNTYNSNRIGKHGLKLMSVSEIKQILESRKESEIQSFQNGGVIGVDVNVIAEGKYHAHLNHLEDTGNEGLTRKGIPVVTHAEGGELEQIAEIEKKELIFRLEVTNKLEELFKDGSEEAMIEAGKLVAEEIIENTQDNSGEVLKDE